MNAEEYKNLVLLKENLSKLKHSPLVADMGFRKLFGAMKDHCECVRMGGPRPMRRRPASAPTSENFGFEASLTSIYVLLSHMLVEVSRSREKKKLQQIQLWFANQLPEIYETLNEPRIVFPTSVQKGVITAELQLGDNQPVTKPKPLFEEKQNMSNSKSQTPTQTATNNRQSVSAPEMLLPKRRPMSASASMAYLDTVMRRVFPDEEALGHLQFASRRGMPFAHRYTAHGGGERPEANLLNGIRQLVVEEEAAAAAELEMTEDGDALSRPQSVIDTSLVDRVAADLEQRRERIVPTPSRGFRQPVVQVEPNGKCIIPIQPTLVASTVPPSSPRAHSSGLDMRRAGSLLLTPHSSSRPRSGHQEEELVGSVISQAATTPYGPSDEIVNVRSTPIPPSPFDGMMSVSKTNVKVSPRSRPDSSQPTLSSKTPVQHTSSTAARMLKQRRELNQAARESAGYQQPLQQAPNPEHDLTDVLRVKFLLRSKNRSSNYRFSMRDHFRMMRQMSAHSQRSAMSSQSSIPTYFSFCASATKRPDEDDEEMDSFDINSMSINNFGRSSAPPPRRHVSSPNLNLGAYGSDILSLVGQVDSAMELSRNLQKELEQFVVTAEAEAEQAEIDEKRPETLVKNLTHIGSSVPIYRASLVNDSDTLFEQADRKRRAAVSIQRVYRGYHVRRQVAHISWLVVQIDNILKGLITVPKGGEAEPTRWQNEAKLYRRIMERIVMHRLEVINNNSGEKYPRRINRPSIPFTLEAFTNYLETKLAVATEFRRRTIGGTVSQTELPPAFKALGVSVPPGQIEAALTERFGMRYRYKTRPLPALDFIDLYWALRPPAGTPPPPKPPPTVTTTIIIEPPNPANHEDKPSLTFITQQDGEVAKTSPPAPPEYSEQADSSNDATFQSKNEKVANTRPRSALPTTGQYDYIYQPSMLRPTSGRPKSSQRPSRSPARPRNVRSATVRTAFNNKR